ncbi:DUF397 domain-containing protein [Actinomadura rugatobispora]|uniref:DUF397 domain-containing protein n=1 Tax=Actinomadura rugatobispora TaxID=1994 RepID=A0ABW1A845_9ACTN|nr:hypothetical protein GCM10010200_026930 [Actinomadura rugatobispora]
MSELVWRKSSRSGTQQGNCVELADLESKAVGVRDSKAQEVGHLALAPACFSDLVTQIKDGALDV